MSTILEHPQAQELLRQTEVEPDTVRRCRQHLTRFIQRYLPFFYRDEQRQHAQIILQGKLTGLQRKTTEPIAIEANLKRRPLQHFVGAGGWEDDAVLTELRRHVVEELADPDGVLVLDPSAFPKKGTASCGVARQWCGRLGKVDNCQAGVFLAYVAPRGKALVAGRLFLPLEQATDRQHRKKTYVPKEITFQEKWRIGLDLVRTAGQELPHGWVVGDDEFGRVTDLRVQLRLAQERYVLDVPCNTQVRDLSVRRPPSRSGGKPRLPLFERVDQWAKRQPKKRWKKIRLPGGEKGPRQVWALQQRVQTRDEEGRLGGSERLVVIKTCGRAPDVWYTLSNCAVGSAAGAGGGRPRLPPRRGGVVCGGQPGSGPQSLRSTELDGLASSHDPIAVGVVVCATRALALGEKKSGDHGVAGAPDIHGVAALSGAECL